MNLRTQNIRQKLYCWLTGQDPEIIRCWQEFRRQNPGQKGRIKGLLLLLAMRVPGIRDLPGFRIQQNPAHLVLQESGCEKKRPKKEWIRRMMSCNVISFDVFDTLLLRPVEDPRDLFYFVGLKLSCPDFRKLRIQAEEDARREDRNRGGCGEVTLEEIWQILSRQTGLDAQMGMEAEWETERRFCFANPLFLPVLTTLRQAGKTLVITSDMYLGSDRIRQLLLDAGLGEFDGYFVSCDEKASKIQGTLFHHIRQRFGSTLRYLHVGDHAFADERMALQNGWEAIRVPSAQELGRPFRVHRLSPIVGSMYRGLSNQRMHGSGHRYSPLYELGYLYGGLLAVGFCQFLHRRAEEKNIDRLLFLARDGEIMQKVYRMLFPDSDTRYAYWSRRVALKLSADERRQEFFQRFLRDKQNQGYSVAECFSSMDLSALLPGFLREAGMEEQQLLTRETADRCEAYLTAHYSLVEEVYEREYEAAGRYVSDLLSGCRRAAVVDIGWAGTGPWALKHLAEKMCPGTEIFTFLAAGAAEKSGDAGKLYPELFSGNMETYLFSPVFNCSLWRFHDPGRGDNLLLELLAASPSPTFAGFSLDQNDQIQLRFGRPEPQAEKIRHIQQGILDFAADWKQHFGSLKKQEISGWDAYAPVRAVLADDRYRKKLERYFSWETSMYVE